MRPWNGKTALSGLELHRWRAGTAVSCAFFFWSDPPGVNPGIENVFCKKIAWEFRFTRKKKEKAENSLTEKAICDIVILPVRVLIPFPFARPGRLILQEVPYKMRTKITLACSDCKQRNYNTFKNKKNDPDRLEMNKYCRFCRKRTVHRESK